MTALESLAGGVLIGVAASALLLIKGRIAGVSGILGGVLRGRRGDVGWRVAFLAGLIAVGVAGALVAPQRFATASVPTPVLVVAGLLVGAGTRLGNGCTSGHGVCGIGRLSSRSLVATAVFIAVGAATVWVARLLGGGA